MAQQAILRETRSRYEAYRNLSEHDVKKICHEHEKQLLQLIEQQQINLSKRLNEAPLILKNLDELAETVEEVKRDQTLADEIECTLAKELNELKTSYTETIDDPPPSNTGFTLNATFKIFTDETGDEIASSIASPDDETSSIVSSLRQSCSIYPSFQLDNHTDFTNQDTASTISTNTTDTLQSIGRGRYRRPSAAENASEIAEPLDTSSVVSEPTSRIATDVADHVRPIEDYIKNDLIYPRHVLRHVDLVAIDRQGKNYIEHTQLPGNAVFGSPEKPQTIIANEIKRRGNIGVDIGDLNTPADAKIFYDERGIAMEYIVLEKGNQRVQSFKGTSDNFELLAHNYLQTGDGGNIRAPLVTNGQWFQMCSFTNDKQHHIYYFIATYNQTNNSVIKCYNDSFGKISNLKLFATCHGICVIPGHLESRWPKLLSIGKCEAKYHFIYQFETFDLVGGQVVKKSKRTPVNFLTELNNENDKTFITYIENYSNQLYIVDQGRHAVYITDLNGNLRRTVGELNQKSSKDGCFHRPTSLTVDAFGNFIVADRERLQAFDINGEFLSVIHTGVKCPAGLQLDDGGRLFMSSMKHNEVYCFQLFYRVQNCLFERPMSQGSQRFFRGSRRGRF